MGDYWEDFFKSNPISKRTYSHLLSKISYRHLYKHQDHSQPNSKLVYQPTNRIQQFLRFSAALASVYFRETLQSRICVPSEPLFPIFRVHIFTTISCCDLYLSEVVSISHLTEEWDLPRKNSPETAHLPNLDL